MATDREISLEQALVAFMGAARERGFDLNSLIEDANLLVMDHSKYRHVEHPHVSNAMMELSLAYATVSGL